MIRAAAAVLALLLLTGPLTGQQTKEKPFPVDKSAILREGFVRYVVEGKQTIPAGVDISVQKNVHIVAKGDAATLRVEGGLKVHGVFLREVIFEGVTIELPGKAGDVRFDAAIFRNGGGIVTAPKEKTVGKLNLLDVQLESGAVFDLTFAEGSIDLSNVRISSATRIVAEKAEGKEKSKVKISVRGCDLADVHFENADDVTFRLSRLAGAVAEFHDCRSLNFDGNKVNAKVLDIRHSVAGGLGKTRVTKCDIYSEKVVVHAPKKDDRSMDQIVLDRCWFEGETDPRKIREELIFDTEKDEANGARVKILKPLERPTELGGEVDR